MPSNTNTNTNDPSFSRSYKDLSKNDIALLAPIFTFPPPPNNTSASSSYHTTTRSLITSLPPHLQSKYPLFNTFCSALHSKLNPLPIISLLGCVQDEVERGRDWKGMLSTEQRASLRGLMGEGKGKCAACRLSRCARDVRALIILGACVIARLGHKKWRRSRRVRWMEAWVRETVEWRGDAESAVREMWDLVLRLRRIKRGDQFSDGSSAPERERRRPLRPGRLEEQDDHIALANEVLQQAETVFPSGANPFAEDADEEVVMRWLFRTSDDGEELPRRETIPDPLELGEAANPFSDQADPDEVMRHLFRNVTATSDQPLMQVSSHASLFPQPSTPQSTIRPSTIVSSVYSRPQHGYERLNDSASNNTVCHRRLFAAPTRCAENNEQSMLASDRRPTTESEILDLYRQSGLSGGERHAQIFL